jgi:hypothetical protein
MKDAGPRMGMHVRYERMCPFGVCVLQRISTVIFSG